MFPLKCYRVRDRFFNKTSLKAQKAKILIPLIKLNSNLLWSFCRHCHFYHCYKMLFFLPFFCKHENILRYSHFHSTWIKIFPISLYSCQHSCLSIEKILCPFPFQNFILSHSCKLRIKVNRKNTFLLIQRYKLLMDF